MKAPHRPVFAPALALGALAVFAADVAAQCRHDFVVDTPGSSFTFSGMVDAFGITGPIVGTPGTFSLSGDAAVDLTTSAGMPTAGQLVGAPGVITVPTLSAEVPSALPFLPPLATIVVTNLTLQFVSVDAGTLAPASFPIAPSGDFTATFTANILSGSAAVTPLIGSQLIVDLTGQTTGVAPTSGSVVVTPGGVDFSIPISSTFAFSDPGTGASGSLTLDGTVAASDLPLAAAVDTISLSAGGVQTFCLSAGAAAAGDTYFILGSVTGTAPGTAIGGVTLPLNVDGYFNQTAAFPSVFPLGNSVGTLDAGGFAQGTFTWPPLLLPALVGLNLDHAYLVLSGTTVTAASNPVGLRFAM
ncbi:MAG: hypothetical protein AAF628_07990 [Planctomycetota bacterium]